ncbi:hypothetical protein ACFLV7_04945 [Chloroflexota bacterium]
MKSFYLFPIILLMGLQACSNLPYLASSTATITQAATELPAATFTPTHPPPTLTPSPSATPTEIPIETRLSDIQQTLVMGIGPTLTPESSGRSHFGGVSDINWFELDTAESDQAYWVFHSVGMRSYEPLQNHFVAIYSLENGDLNEIDRVEMQIPDYIGVGSVKQVPVEPDGIWLQVMSGVGAHSGCFDLLRFDGGDIEHVLSDCASSPDAGEVRDLDGDGISEVLLNWSEDYVFCYACGVRIRFYQVWRWNGTQLVQVELTELIGSYPQELVQMNNRAVELANGELWKDARQSIEGALEISGGDETVFWNAVLIDLIAQSRDEEVERSQYPLLTSIFLGDYESTVDLMRSHRPWELFGTESVLVSQTAAEGWEKEIKNWIILFTDKALEAEPDMAAAYFLRAWAIYIVDKSDPGVMKNLRKAVVLNSKETLYLETLRYLEGDG